MQWPNDASDRLGTALVGLQFLLLGVLAWHAVDGLRRSSIPLDALLGAIAAVFLGLWALRANRPGNFNIRPVPRVGGHLVESGPYRWIRHPMYSALILAGLAAARSSIGASAWLALAGLVVVLVLKAGIEERAMIARHHAYRAYQRRTWRFVPGIF